MASRKKPQARAPRKRSAQPENTAQNTREREREDARAEGRAEAYADELGSDSFSRHLSAAAEIVKGMHGEDEPAPEVLQHGRLPNGRWAKGFCPNPAGRPKKLQELEEEILTHQGPNVPVMLNVLFARGIAGDNEAAKAWLDRVLGKSKARTEITGKDGGDLFPKSDPISALLDRMDDADRAAIGAPPRTDPPAEETADVRPGSGEPSASG